MSCQIPEERITATIAFHGHSCPGLAIGIRAAELALRELENPADSEIVAVVETDMCGVDAIQFLTGATVGKGNLIHRDHGKMAFSFFRRATGRGFRAVLNPDARGGMDEDMAELMKKSGNGTATAEDKQRLTEPGRAPAPLHDPAPGRDVPDHAPGSGRAPPAQDSAKPGL